MFTENDLQQLRMIIREEVQAEVGSAMDKRLEPVKSEITSIKLEMTSVKLEITSVKDDLQFFRDETNKKFVKIDKNFRSLRKELRLVTRVFDKDIAATAQKTQRIEHHLNLPPLHY